MQVTAKRNRPDHTIKAESPWRGSVEKSSLDNSILTHLQRDLAIGVHPDREALTLNPCPSAGEGF